MNKILVNIILIALILPVVFFLARHNHNKLQASIKEACKPTPCPVQRFSFCYRDAKAFKEMEQREGITNYTVCSTISSNRPDGVITLQSTDGNSTVTITPLPDPVVAEEVPPDAGVAK